MGLRNVMRGVLRDRGIKLPDGLLKDDEPYMRQVAKRLNPGDLVLDLGAHLGHASIEFSHFAGEVHAFEPHPEIFAQLTQNVRKYPKIKPMQKAVSDTTGTAQLFFEPMQGKKHYEGSTLVEAKTNLGYDNAFDVETVRLADLLTQLGRPVRLIKMDIEGAEYRVLRDLIESPARDLVGEVHVECHVGRVTGLEAERAAFEARVAELGLGEKFDLTWP